MCIVISTIGLSMKCLKYFDKCSKITKMCSRTREVHVVIIIDSEGLTSVM